MLKVALATSAAPSYYRPLRADGYTFVDGGVWANNPVMIALVEALASFDVSREQIRILSLGCGEGLYSGSCPRPWCRSGYPEQRWPLDQAATVGRVTMGASLRGAMVSRLM